MVYICWRRKKFPYMILTRTKVKSMNETYTSMRPTMEHHCGRKRIVPNQILMMNQGLATSTLSHQYAVPQCKASPSQLRVGTRRRTITVENHGKNQITPIWRKSHMRNHIRKGMNQNHQPKLPNSHGATPITTRSELHTKIKLGYFMITDINILNLNIFYLMEHITQDGRQRWIHISGINLPQTIRNYLFLLGNSLEKP